MSEDITEAAEKLARARSYYRACVRWYMEAFRYHSTVMANEDWTNDGRDLHEDAKLALQEATQGVLDARTRVQRLQRKFDELRGLDKGLTVIEDDDE